MTLQQPNVFILKSHLIERNLMVSNIVFAPLLILAGVGGILLPIAGLVLLVMIYQRIKRIEEKLDRR